MHAVENARGHTFHDLFKIHKGRKTLAEFHESFLIVVSFAIELTIDETLYTLLQWIKHQRNDNDPCDDKYRIILTDYIWEKAADAENDPKINGCDSRRNDAIDKAPFNHDLNVHKTITDDRIPE